MAYKQFDGNRDWATGDDITAARVNAWVDGVQDEFEERLAAGNVCGVISGFGVTTSAAATIAIAAGDAYAGGKRFSGAGTVTFDAGDAADDYYIFIDSSDETTPYDKTTTAPTFEGDDLQLAKVTWDGGTNLSALADTRRWGIMPMAVAEYDPATVSAGTLFFGIVERDMWLRDVQIVQKDNGSAGTTIVDVHTGSAGSAPVTVFTTQANRPTLGHATADYTVASSGQPETGRKLSAGDLLEIIVDSAATGAQDLAVVIRGRYY